jgi:hypothetical protein
MHALCSQADTKGMLQLILPGHHVTHNCFKTNQMQARPTAEACTQHAARHMLGKQTTKCLCVQCQHMIGSKLKFGCKARKHQGVCTK